MAAGEPAGRAGEASVGHERAGLAETCADNGAGDRKHPAHARPAARPFVANDDDVARLDRLMLDRIERSLFAVEDARRTAMLQPIRAGNLEHRAVWREAAAQNHQPTAVLQRAIDGTHDFL